jgi:hypothetical protein
MRSVVASLAFLAGCDFGLDAPRRGDAGDAIDSAPIDVRIPADGAPAWTSCKDAQLSGVMTDGVIMIDPDGAGPGSAEQVYCDMTTAGGGWTLVYSYGFTNYNAFTRPSNAVTPRPDWGVPGSSGTPISTTTPTSPTTRGAMPYATWQLIGSEVLLTSNINNWIRCTAGTGSLVTMTDGTVTCDVIKVLTSSCTTVAPDGFVRLSGCGPVFQLNGMAYQAYDGNTTQNWPTHDPCGTDMPNQLTNIPNPGGAIFLR